MAKPIQYCNYPPIKNKNIYIIYLNSVFLSNPKKDAMCNISIAEIIMDCFGSYVNIEQCHRNQTLTKCVFELPFELQVLS